MFDFLFNILFLVFDENMLSCWLLFENNEVFYWVEEIEIEKGINVKEFF